MYNVISTTIQDLSHLDFDLLRSLKVLFNYAVRLSIYAFLLVFNGNLHVWPNASPLSKASKFE